MFLFRSNINCPASIWGVLRETNQRAEAGAAPAGGLVTRSRATPATKGSMESEQPQWSAAGECPDRKGHGDASQASFGVARTHAKVRLAPAPSAFSALRSLYWRESERKRRPVRLEGRKRPNGGAALAV